MDSIQFETIAKLIRSRGPSKEAARLVIIEGVSRKEAAERTGIVGPSVTGAVKRFRQADEMIRQGYPEGMPNEACVDAMHLAIACMTRSSRLANFRFVYTGDDDRRDGCNKLMPELINRELTARGLQQRVSEAFVESLVAGAISVDGLDN